MESHKFNLAHSSTASKGLWRNSLKKIRELLPTKRRLEASEIALCDLLEKLKKARFVLSFASFDSEIDLWHLNEILAFEGRLVLPALDEKYGWRLFHVNHFSQLEKHHWGMLEPKVFECASIDFGCIDVALIPGLGFDLTTKHRLGYGQGFYDRLLKQKDAHTKAWGVGFSEQVVNGLLIEPWDIALDEIYLF